jgi:hypothetical protein
LDTYLPEGYVHRQYELAQQMKKDTMQWRSPELVLEDIHDKDWYLFLSNERVQVLTLEDFASEIIQTILYPPHSGGKSAGCTPRLAFLDADNDDRDLARDVAKRLIQFGVDCIFPLSSHRPASTRKMFEQSVLNCDGMMLIYGSVSPEWICERFLSIRKVESQRPQRFGAYAIYDGPPEAKPPVNIMSSRIEVLQCRSRIDDQQIEHFANLIHTGANS